MSYRIIRRIHRYPTSKTFITEAERYCFCIVWLLLISFVVILPTIIIYLSVLSARGSCTYYLGYYKRQTPVTAILSPPGCGSDWVGYILQQISGYHVGSIQDRTGASVIAVESSHLNLIGHVDRAIVVIRDPYECIRVSYDQLKPDISFGTYYLDHSDLWNEYAISAIDSWEKLYINYLGFAGPILFVHHSNLKNDIRSEMHRLTKFLNIPADIGKFKCVSYNSNSLTYKYTPIKTYFDPYKLLKPTVHKMMNVSKITVMKLINQRIRDRK